MQCKNNHDLFAVKCFDLYKQYKKPAKAFYYYIAASVRLKLQILYMMQGSKV